MQPLSQMCSWPPVHSWLPRILSFPLLQTWPLSRCLQRLFQLVSLPLQQVPLLPGRCAPGLPFDFGGRPPRREPHRSGSHLHGLAHRSPSQTGPISLSDPCHPSGTQHFWEDPLQLHRVRCLPRNCRDHLPRPAPSGQPEAPQKEGPGL